MLALELIQVEKEAGIAVVTINNPPLNVLSSKVTEELNQAFLSLKADEEVIAVILTGAGERAFMAGADITEFPALMGNPNIKGYVMDTHHFLNELADFPKPTIAALNGLTFGGGCELALACDIRIADENIQIGLPEVKLGLFPGGGGTQRLPRLVGEAKAKQLMYTGEPIPALEALQIGLVNEVVASGTALAEARKLADKIASNSLSALSRIKKAVNSGMQMELKQGLEYEADLFAEVFQTEDIQEGVSAFLEKRKPSFKHR